MLATALGCYLLYNVSNSSSYAEIWWKLIILGVGFGLTFPLLPRVGLRLVREQDAGQASGVINTCLFFGATIGIVVGGLAAAMTTRTQLSNVIAALPVGSQSRENLAATLTHGSGGAIQNALGRLEPPTTQALAAALRDLRDDAFDAAMLTAAAVAAIGVVLAIWLMRGPVPEPRSAAKLLPPEAPSEGQEAVAR
jgi:hypothetical protein